MGDLTTLDAMASGRDQFDIVVIGGGHAGIEAASVAARGGARTALLTLRAETIGVMSCNPAIGGLAKGQIVREVDALGGLMGRLADATGIMFKVLNTSRGPAVHGPRAQCDRHAYARAARQAIESHANLVVVTGAVQRLIVEDHAGGLRCIGVEIVDRDSGRAMRLHAGAVVLTTGTFMRGLMHEGARRTEGGRAGERAVSAMSANLEALGFELGRLKTGTPPRLARGSIDWDALESQKGDEPPTPFSELTDHEVFPRLKQVCCRVTRTTPAIHDLICANLHRAPMYSGQIESAGPRYCPSIEDKVVRFGERESHHVFLEPESHEGDWIYCNGISTSLPRDVQERMVRGMPGCAGARIHQFGYAVEYDMVRPHQIRATGETKLVGGLFLAGQINGTSGYEEAAAQGVIAGLNALRRLRGENELVLGRDQAFIGVLMDDLITKTPREPYRMFTSRAEHRLLLRGDNAPDRLTGIGREEGVICDERWGRHRARLRARRVIDELIDGARIDSEPLALRIRRPGYSPNDLRRDLGEALSVVGAEPGAEGAMRTALAERQYEGYIARQRAHVKRSAQIETRRIPGCFDARRVQGLRAEASDALARFRPSTLGQAGRLEGVNPADLTLVVIELERLGAARRATQDTSAARA